MSANVTQKTLILFKPDAVQRRLCGKLLTRFEEKGLRIAAMKLMKIDDALAAKHYEAHKTKGFYAGLVKFMTSSPVMALVLEGPHAVEVCRNMMGATFGFKAAPGTIRGDFGLSVQNNLVHGSDSTENATAEIALWFKPDELVAFTPTDGTWVG